MGLNRKDECLLSISDLGNWGCSSGGSLNSFPSVSKVTRRVFDKSSSEEHVRLEAQEYIDMLHSFGLRSHEGIT